VLELLLVFCEDEILRVVFRDKFLHLNKTFVLFENVPGKRCLLNVVSRLVSMAVLALDANRSTGCPQMGVKVTDGHLVFLLGITMAKHFDTITVNQMLSKLRERKNFLRLLLLTPMPNFHLVNNVSEHIILDLLKDSLIIRFTIRAFLQINLFLGILHL